MSFGIIEKFAHFRSKKLTDSARGQLCMNCGADDGTTVSAHSNLHEHGKSGAIKAADIFIAWLCAKCHYWYDGGRGQKVSDPTGIWTSGERQPMWQRAHDKTLLKIFGLGLVQVK